MRAYPDSECPDCKEKNGRHTAECVKMQPKFLPGVKVKVVDLISPFYRWAGAVYGSRPDGRAGMVPVWYYGARMASLDGQGPQLHLTFRQEQLEAVDA